MYISPGIRTACLVPALCLIRVPTATTQVALEIKDFLVMPMTGSVDGKGSNNNLLLSRVNTLREETGGAKRLFVSDLNGPLYTSTRSRSRSRCISSSTAIRARPASFES
jgi:hypothetical protein